MTDLFTAALFVGLIIFVGYPLLRDSGASRQDVSAEARLRHLGIVRDELLASLKDAELELQMGKLSQADHQQIKTEIEAQALEVLREIDQTQARIPAHPR